MFVSEIKFDCLGHWKGNNGETFLVFTDNRHATDHLPQYRCAVSISIPSGTAESEKKTYS